MRAGDEIGQDADAGAAQAQRSCMISQFEVSAGSVERPTARSSRAPGRRSCPRCSRSPRTPRGRQSSAPAPARRRDRAARKPQPVVGDLAHGQPPRGGRRDVIARSASRFDSETSAAGRPPGPAGRDWRGRARRRRRSADSSTPVRRADPHRAGQPVRLAAGVLDGGGRRGLHRLGVLEQVSSRFGHHVALRRAVESFAPSASSSAADPPATVAGRARASAPPSAAASRATARNTRRSSHFIAFSAWPPCITAVAGKFADRTPRNTACARAAARSA